MIERLHVRGYKSLADTELPDLTRLVVLYGPNAAGKSNVLDVLDLVGHLVREDTVLQAFQRHRGNRLDRPAPVRWFFTLPANKSARDRMELELDMLLNSSVVGEINQELEERERLEHLERSYTRVTQERLRYRVVLEYEGEARSLNVVEESLVSLSKSGEVKSSVTPFIRFDNEERRAVVKLERQAHPRYFPLPRSRTILSEIRDPVHHPHLVAAARELASTRVYYIEPTRMRGAVNDVRAEDPGPHGEQLASFYHWLKREHPKRFKNLQTNLTQIVPTVSGVSVRESDEGFVELWVSEGDRGEFHAAQISEGTLRLMCLLGIAASPRPPAIVGYEEPENGVNPGRLDTMVSILQTAAGRDTGSQFFLTTHSSAVLDLLDDAHRVLVVRDQGVTVLRSEEEAGSLFGPGMASALERGEVSLGDLVYRGNVAEGPPTGG